MKVTFCIAVLPILLSVCTSEAAFITQSIVRELRFVGASPVQTSPEPLRLGVEAVDEVFLLNLGSYSSDDAGKTFSIMREPETNAEWDAVSAALRTATNTPRTGFPTMWLGLDEYKTSGSSFFLSEGFPNYNLQRVEITPHYYRLGTAGSDTFRTAAFDARFYWVIPEPTTGVLATGAALLLMFCSRRWTVRRD
jgi:hypothetical protein